MIIIPKIDEFVSTLAEKKSWGEEEWGEVMVTSLVGTSLPRLSSHFKWFRNHI